MVAISFTLAGRQFDLSNDDVRSRIAQHHPEPVDTYWVEIDGARWPVKQVLALATGLPKRDFQSQNSRRLLARLGFTIGSGAAAIATSAVATRSSESAKTEPGTSPQQTVADVVLVGCVKTKLDHGAPARDLYVSDYFAKMRSYAEATGLPWFILSAEHGLVAPDDWLEPYERYLPDTTHEYRRGWGEKAAAQLQEAIGSLDGLVVDVHAGSTYVASAEGPLRRRGAEVLDQLAGLSFGRRLSWYLQHEPGAPVAASTILTQLRDPDAAMTLDQVRASGGAGFRVPGLYSWWVDDSGALDLTSGLGHQVDPGLIYAGLAGATRSGGSSSSNTLWGRIATMHLGKKHEFSTLRRSLGSVLASAYGQAAIDEEQLTRWMHAHLRVVLVPYPDVDSLGDLETEVLLELDPPLNLAKVEKTPLRRELSALRKRYAGRSAGLEGEK
ncbi:DUF6884 domain-containing protein [Nocardioides acrostichi]|uniref:Uncharacterized protein n=1 Tax=Nocardioides acrostichi TaxID=2784339 RepID=A0A930V0Q7_9ACTN|nr:DUF6884 domain-containing protein [Nocardioides acrostichi]MBF4161595.1 hypothetical protein [Nocardioides acrostichi]